MKTGILLSSIWNDAVISKADRELKPRDYVWASELGYPMIDRYLKMTAVTPTNPPNERSRRKFFGGNVWEMIVWMAFNFAGLVISKQEEVWVRDGAIPVKGKLDFIIGGTPDFDRARAAIASIPMPEDMKAFFAQVIERMSQTYTGDFHPAVKEIKSLSSFMFEKLDKQGRGTTQHELQVFHYKRGTGIERGSLCYVCRDDARLLEFALIDEEGIKKAYYDDLAAIAAHIAAKEQPAPAPLMLWEGKFSKNLGVEYSPYLEMIYGFKTPEDYRNAVDGKIGRWNRVIKRISDKATMTANNKEALEEMKREGHNVDELVAKAAQNINDETETE